VKRIAIIGASGAIGKAFVDLYAARESTETLHAFSRSAAEFSDDRIISHPLDLENPASIEGAAKTIAKNSLDLVIVATGLLHSAGDSPLQPEKALHEIDADHMQRVFTINTIGPALLMKHFMPLMTNKSRCIFAVLSARVGSISDNYLGGWYSYRASKAALNMLVKTSAIESRRRNKESIVVGLHPGTVDSNLSRPYQSRVEKDKLFTPVASAQHLTRVLDSLQQSDTGACFAWDGKPVPA